MNEESTELTNNPYYIIKKPDNSDYIEIKSILDQIDLKIRQFEFYENKFTYQEFNEFSNALEYIVRAPFKAKFNELKSSLDKAIINLSWFIDSVRDNSKIKSKKDSFEVIFYETKDRVNTEILREWFEYKLKSIHYKYHNELSLIFKIMLELLGLSKDTIIIKVNYIIMTLELLKNRVTNE